MKGGTQGFPRREVGGNKKLVGRRFAVFRTETTALSIRQQNTVDSDTSLNQYICCLFVSGNPCFTPLINHNASDLKKKSFILLNKQAPKNSSSASKHSKFTLSWPEAPLQQPLSSTLFYLFNILVNTRAHWRPAVLGWARRFDLNPQAFLSRCQWVFTKSLPSRREAFFKGFLNRTAFVASHSLFCIRLMKEGGVREEKDKGKKRGKWDAQWRTWRIPRACEAG